MPSRDSSRWLLPAGVFEMPPRKAAYVRSAEDALLAVLRRWGYREVRTPAMEYLDAMARGVGEAELDNAFKFIDRETGRMMTLRSDLTPQVARMAALALGEVPRPLRLCYLSEVYRTPLDPSRSRREILQAGAELIGVPGPEGDAEAIALAGECLRELGFASVRFSVTHTRYARAALAEAGLAPAASAGLLSAATRKDRGEAERILDAGKAPARVREALLLLAELGGEGKAGAERMLERAEAAAPNAEARSAVSELAQVVALAEAAGLPPGSLTPDLGDLSAFHYHSGVAFAGFVEGVGRPVADGGRYDDLIGRYGAPCPATGFALDLLELAEVSPAARASLPPAGVALCDRSGRPGDALALARKMRGEGTAVALLPPLPDRELKEYARAHGAEGVMVLEKDGRLVRLDPGGEESSDG